MSEINYLQKIEPNRIISFNQTVPYGNGSNKKSVFTKVNTKK